MSISKKKIKAIQLIELDRMLRHQKRNGDGSAKFTKEQLKAAEQVIENILKIDGINRQA